MKTYCLTFYHENFKTGYVFLERAVEKNDKLESFKLESFAAVGKFWLKLETSS